MIRIDDIVDPLLRKLARTYQDNFDPENDWITFNKENTLEGMEFWCKVEEEIVTELPKESPMFYKLLRDMTAEEARLLAKEKTTDIDHVLEKIRNAALNANYRIQIADLNSTQLKKLYSLGYRSNAVKDFDNLYIISWDYDS